jgi:hypothetical protein
VVVANPPVLAPPGVLASSTDPEDFAVGIMRGRTDQKHYLLILNKDAFGTDDRMVTLGLQRSAVPERFDKASGEWVRLSGRTREFSLRVAPGDLEMVRLGRVAEVGGRLCHYWRDNDDGGSQPVFEWHETECFASNAFATDDSSDWAPAECFAGHLGSSAALIQSNFGSQGNFEVIVERDGKLCHYWRDNDDGGSQPVFEWHETECFASNAGSAPSLIQSTFGRQGNFEVAAYPFRSGRSTCGTTRGRG